VFKFFNSAIISVLILACASHKNADVPQFFDYWVPFKLGKTYQGHHLEASVVKGDKLLQEKRYESAYAQYKEALTSSRHTLDLYHRLAVTLILMKQPRRALDIALFRKSKVYFKSLEGQIIVLKAYLDSDDFRSAVSIADEILSKTSSPRVSRVLETLFSETSARLLPRDRQHLTHVISQTKRLKEQLKVESLDFRKDDKDEARYKTNSFTLEDSRSLNICALLPLSGKAENLGKKVANGLNLAFELFAPTGLDLFIKDTTSSSLEFEQIFESLKFETSCHFYVGPFFSDAIEAFLKLNTQRVPALTLTRSSIGSDFLVNFGLSTLSQALTLLNFFQTNNLTRIFLLTRENNFSKEFKVALNNVLQNYPQIRVLGEFELKYFGDQSAAQLEKTLQSLNPQVVLFTLNLAEAADFFMSLDEEIKTRFVFVGTSIIDDQDEIRKFSNIFAGTLYPSFYLKNESSALNQLFSDEYRKKFGGTPDMFSALGFDAGLLLISTWKNLGALNKSTILQEAQRLSFLTGTPLVLPDGVFERLLKIVEIQRDGSLKSVN